MTLLSVLVVLINLSIAFANKLCDATEDETEGCDFQCQKDATKTCADFFREAYPAYNNFAHQCTEDLAAGNEKIYCKNVEGWLHSRGESEIEPYANHGCNAFLLSKASWNTRQESVDDWLRMLRNGCHIDGPTPADITMKCSQYNGRRAMPKKNGLGQNLRAADVGGNFELLTIYRMTGWAVRPCKGLSLPEAKKQFWKALGVKEVNQDCTAQGAACGPACNCDRSINRCVWRRTPISEAEVMCIGITDTLSAHISDNNVYRDDMAYLFDNDSFGYNESYNRTVLFYGCLLLMGMTCCLFCMMTSLCTGIFGYFVGRKEFPSFK